MRAAKTIANSPLVKTAVHGGDPNWGRLVAASGRSGARFVLEHATVEVGDVLLFKNGQPYDEHASEAAEAAAGLGHRHPVDLGTGGSGEATAWTCDLSAEYVRINGEYPDMSRPSTLRAGARVRALKPTPPPAPMKARSFISLGDFIRNRCPRWAVMKQGPGQAKQEDIRTRQRLSMISFYRSQIPG